MRLFASENALWRRSTQKIRPPSFVVGMLIKDNGLAPARGYYKPNAYEAQKRVAMMLYKHRFGKVNEDVLRFET